MLTRFRRFFAPLLFSAALAHASGLTALDRYVAEPDPHYKFELVKTITTKTYTLYVIDLTSQQWRTAAEVDHPIWHHWLSIIRPASVTGTTGFLFITGGSIGRPAPSSAEPPIVALALSSHSVAAELRDVPNEPLVFAGDGKRRSEDAIIAYTWDKYLRGGDDYWPLRLPMTKAAVRAMDTVTAFMKEPEHGALNVEHFVVAGASKRGWTTWTTAAVDKRVIACAPIVIDLLNIVKSFDHHYRAYGFWAPAIKDYQEMGIMDWTGSAQYRKLMREVEPFSYRSRLTMPKYIINASGDQFFLPDSSQFYWSSLKGEKFLRYVPNTGHSLDGTDVADSLIAYYDALVAGKPLPSMAWKFEKDGAIRVVAHTAPSKVVLWQATDPNARDFRVDTIGKAYKPSPLAPAGNGVYVARVPRPPKGWTAYFVELSYPMGGHTMKITSGVRVTPDTLPYGPPRHVPPSTD